MALTQNATVLKAVEKYKYKRGIQYAGPDSHLFSRLRLFLLLSTVYFGIFNLFYIIGSVIVLQSADNKEQLGTFFNNLKPTLIPVCITFMLVITGLVFSYLTKAHIKKVKLQPIGCLIIPVATIYNFIIYLCAVLTVQHSGLDENTYPFSLPLPDFFYWRNLLPCFLVVVFGIWMSVLYIRSKRYDKIVYEAALTSLYERYQKDDRRGYTDEEWADILQEIEEKGYKSQFDE